MIMGCINVKMQCVVVSMCPLDWCCEYVSTWLVSSVICWSLYL